jgi:hypothetical protein
VPLTRKPSARILGAKFAKSAAIFMAGRILAASRGEPLHPPVQATAKDLRPALTLGLAAFLAAGAGGRVRAGKIDTSTCQGFFQRVMYRTGWLLGIRSPNFWKKLRKRPRGGPYPSYRVY